MYQEYNVNDNADNKIYVGKIDERGLINSFDRQGVTMNKGIFELIGNSIDSNATNIHIKIYNKNNIKFISIVDNGIGMNKDDLLKAFNICGENHKNKKKIGVSGVGLKISTKCLSKNTDVDVYTKTENNEIYKATIPWCKIIEEGRWSGNVKIEKCTKRIDKKIYKNIVQHKCGTGIMFKYSEDLKNSILNQFINEEKYKLKKEDRLDYIFGSCNVNIVCSDTSDYYQNKYKLELYNPFNLDKDNYIYYKNITIDCFINKINNNIQFAKKINNDDYECFEYAKKNIKRTISIKKFNNSKFKMIGSFKLNICSLKLSNNNLEIEQLLEFNNMNKYIKNFYGNYDNLIESLNNYNDAIILKRNNAIIGNMIYNKKRYSEKKYKFLSKNILMELVYNPYSSQQNIFDNIIGIQGNKHQYVTDEKKLETLLRLCKYIKDKTIQKIEYKLLNNIIQESKDSEENNDINVHEENNDIVNKVSNENDHELNRRIEENKEDDIIQENNYIEINTKEFIKILKEEFKKQEFTKGNYYKYNDICNNLINKIFEK